MILRPIFTDQETQLELEKMAYVLLATTEEMNTLFSKLREEQVLYLNTSMYHSLLKWKKFKKNRKNLIKEIHAIDDNL